MPTASHLMPRGPCSAALPWLGGAIAWSAAALVVGAVMAIFFAATMVVTALHGRVVVALAARRAQGARGRCARRGPTRPHRSAQRRRPLLGRLRLGQWPLAAQAFPRSAPLDRPAIRERDGNEPMIGIVATLKVQHGKGAEFEALFKDLAEKVRANEAGHGVLSAHQEPHRADTYKVLELYKDQDALTPRPERPLPRAGAARRGPAWPAGPRSSTSTPSSEARSGPAVSSAARGPHIPAPVGIPGPVPTAVRIPVETDAKARAQK